MAIKCSLLGHKFSGTEVEEEREEQGSEVVITIEEVEVCERCGKRRVVSENKEVTSLAASDEGESDAESESPPEPAAEPEPEAEAAETDAQAPPPGPDMSAAEDDAELLDAGGDSDDAATADDEPEPEPEPDIATAGETGVEDEPAAEDDGAVILDDDEEDEREPGEWPEDEAAPEAETEPEPEAIEQAATEAVEDSEEPATESAETEEWPDEYGYEEESAKAPEVDWPEEDEGDGEEWEPGESLTQRIDSDVEPAGAATVTVPEGEFYCPECEFTTLVEESSLRAGDFCPSCRRGSLEHRAEDATRKE